jgi:hypothetical protein
MQEVNKQTLEETAEPKWSLEKAQEFAIDKFKSKHKKGTVTWELILEVLKIGVLTGHKFGAKWQAENIIEELETHILINEHDWNRNPQAQFKDFVEKFKKK